MADLSITAASVVAGANAVLIHGMTAGETLTAGKTAYMEASTKLIKMADSNSATAEAKTPAYFILNGAATGQPVSLLKEGDLTIGATLTPGSPYFQSETPGGIQPAADLASGEYVTQVGIAKSTTVLAVKFITPGVTL